MKGNRCRLGRRITTLKQLIDAANARATVIVPTHGAWNWNVPAAFLQNQMGRDLHFLFLRGMYFYHPFKKPAAKDTHE